MMRRRHSTYRNLGTRRGFTLVESIVVVVVVALLVPPAVSMLQSAQTSRVDSANTLRASVLAGAVMEQVLADASSPAASLGMAAFAAPATYTDTATTGLKARLAAVTSAYQTQGLTWSLSIGGLVSKTGSADADSAKNIFRTVTVTVTWNSTRAGVGSRSYALTSLVTDLTP
jgi:prepilin-type N-terminal cleavage/methylation domain-containing protein